MIQRTNTYETLFIVNPVLEDSQIDAIVTRTKELIEKHGGVIKSLEPWGRKRMAYIINKKNNGYYALIEFDAPAESITSLERFYNLEEEVMRHIIVKLDKKTLLAKSLKKEQAIRLNEANKEQGIQ